MRVPQRWDPFGVNRFKERLQSFRASMSMVIGHDSTSIFFLIFLGSFVCVALGLNGTTLRGRDFEIYSLCNYVQSIIGLALVTIGIVRAREGFAQTAAYIFLYSINMGNLCVAVAGQMDDKLAYQYLLFFIILSWFFRTRVAFSINVIVNCFGVLIMAILPHSYNSAPSDFFITFAGGTFGLVILSLNRIATSELLQVSEHRYRLLAENSADLICTHTENGDFEFVSPSIFALAGYKPTDLAGRSPLSFVHPDDARMFSIGISQQAEQTGDSPPIQYRFKKANGGYIYLESVFKPIESAGTRGYLSQTRSFQRHIEYLTQIEKNSRELENSYKDLETFAYISSHDMQEPLRMISNYMQLLKRKYDSKLDTDALEYIDFAVKGASNLQALIKDMLAYSTLNKKEISIDKIDMERVMDTVLTTLASVIRDRNVKVQVANDLIPIEGDKNAIMLLMQNLVQNGIKYNTSEAPLITIRCSQTPKEVRYTITDNGIGMDSQYLQKIFEPFQRLHNKYEYQGTGLGLSICMRIVERHQGRIWADSTLGEGSSFTFVIPKNL